MILGNHIDQAYLLKLKQNRESLNLVEAVELASLEFIQKRRMQHQKKFLPQINEENASCSRSCDNTPKSGGSLRSDGYESLRESIPDSPSHRLSKEFNLNMVA